MGCSGLQPASIEPQKELRPFFTVTGGPLAGLGSAGGGGGCWRGGGGRARGAGREDEDEAEAVEQVEAAELGREWLASGLSGRCIVLYLGLGGESGFLGDEVGGVLKASASRSPRREARKASSTEGIIRGTVSQGGDGEGGARSVRVRLVGGWGGIP